MIKSNENVKTKSVMPQKLLDLLHDLGGQGHIVSTGQT